MSVEDRDMRAGDAARLPGFSADTQRVWRHRRVIEGIGAEGAGSRRTLSSPDITALWATERLVADGLDLRLSPQLGRMARQAIVALLCGEPSRPRFVVSTFQGLDGDVTPADDPAALGPFERAIVIDLPKRVRAAYAALRLAAREASRH